MSPPSPNSASSADQSRWFSDQVQPHEPALRAWLRARFPSLDDRDDLVQESYVRILQAHSAGPIDSAKAFLFATARNLALNHLRHRRHDPKVLGDFDPSVVLDDSPAVSETVARSQEIQILTEALQSLPDRCREVFTLRRLHGLSTKETAARLGLSEKTVEAQCVIALRKCVMFFRQAQGPLAARLPVDGPHLPHA